MPRRFELLRSAAALPMVLAFSAAAHAQISASPVIVTIVGEQAGTLGEDLVRVRNEGSHPLNIELQLADFTQREDLSHEFFGFGTQQRSCASRLSISPRAMVLQPDETRAVQLRMQGGETSCWAVLLVEPRTDTSNGISARGQIGVKIYGVPRTEGGQGRIASAEVLDGTTRLRVRFENTGELPLRPQGTIEVRTFDGETVAEMEIAPFSALPEQARVLEFDLPIGEPGDYVAVPMLDFGAAYLSAAQAVFSVR